MLEQDLGKSQFLTNQMKSVNAYRGLVLFMDHMLGEGSNGQVFKGQIGYGTYEARDSAVKVFQVPDDATLQKYLNKELDIMRSIDHKNIVKFYDAVISDRNYYIFMEYCSGPSLTDKIQPNGRSIRIPEGQTLEIMSKIIEALQYLSQVKLNLDDNKTVGLVHRDLKPDNIIFHNGIPKLIDFGFSKPIGTETITLFTGSPLYMSPQNLSESPYNPEKNDVWSFGIMLFEMVEADYPWRREVDDLNGLLLAQKTINWKFNYASKELQELIIDMVQFDENRRPGWNQIMKYKVLNPYLQHTVEGLQKFEKLQKQYAQYQQCVADTQYSKFDNLISELTMYELTKNLDLINKNTDIEEFYKAFMYKYIFTNNEHRTEFELKMELRLQVKELINHIVDHNLIKSNGLITLLNTVMFWYDGKERDQIDESTIKNIRYEI